MAEVKNFPVDAQINVANTYLNKDGGIAQVDGIPTWTVKSGEVTVVPAEDGLSGKIKSTGVATLYEVEVKADADLDNDEVRDLIITITGSVTALEAVSATTSIVTEPLEA